MGQRAIGEISAPADKLDIPFYAHRVHCSVVYEKPTGVCCIPGA
jgi:hypothetical protein